MRFCSLVLQLLIEVRIVKRPLPLLVTPFRLLLWFVGARYATGRGLHLTRAHPLWNCVSQNKLSEHATTNGFCSSDFRIQQRFPHSP